MATKKEPSVELSKDALPEALNKALVHIFSQGLRGVMLVGGTALSGFYAGHRRSDDLDLFVKDDVAFKSTLLAVQSLTTIGATIQKNAHSNQYFNALCHLDGHTFTVDIVLDENIFNVGHATVLGNNISVVDLATLFKMKSATLLSRCSEKDLYDLIWLFDEFGDINIKSIIKEGGDIDGGMDPETLLYSLSTANLREEACAFAEKQKLSSRDVLKKILKFKNLLIEKLNDHLDHLPSEDLKKTITRVKRL